jgi:carboxymethylenebutenolidase
LSKHLRLEIASGPFDVYVASPNRVGPRPGVVVLHDALGMSNDARRQADWLASEGYLAACPDLFDDKDLFRCMFSVMRDFVREAGPTFEKVMAVREHLAQHERCTGRVGVIGFCFGGGFALMLAPRSLFAAASVNYGPLPSDAETRLASACPIVGSYGAQDRTLRGAASRLRSILTAAGVEHDVREYPDAGHAFLNDHSDDGFPFYMKALAGVMGGGGYHEPSAQHARGRILEFFRQQLE